MQLNTQEIMNLLPHRYPFLLVDRIEEVTDEGGVKTVKGYKNVSINEPFFQGHFPEEYVMPGVLILESMGQVGAVLVKLQPEFNDGKRHILYLTSIDKAKFHKPVRPGDQLRTTGKLKRRRGNMVKFEFVAYVDGEMVAEAEMGCFISDD